MTTPVSSPSPCDKALQEAVEAWRKQHKLREDDAVILLMQLLKIHQKHWMALWKEEMPSFDPLQKDIQTLSSLHKGVHKQALALSCKLTQAAKERGTFMVTLSSACLASVACLLAGYIWGKGLL